MAEQRVVQTAFWGDHYISSLSKMERYLFLYLLTNPQTNISGVYQLWIKYIILDTDLEKKEIEDMMAKFEKDGRLMYRESWVAIKNWMRHQNQGSHKVKQGIEKYISKAPKWCSEYLAIPYAYPIAPKPKLESESKLEPQSKLELEELPIGNWQPDSPVALDVREDQKENVEKIIEDMQSYTYPEKTKGKERLDITEMLSFLKQQFSLDDFTEVHSKQRICGLNLVNLKLKISSGEFERRVKELKSDPKRLPKCNSLDFIFAQLKAQENKTAKKKKEEASRSDGIAKEKKMEDELIKQRSEETKRLKTIYLSLPPEDQDKIQKEAKSKLEGMNLFEEKEKENNRLASYENILQGSILKITHSLYGESLDML